MKTWILSLVALLGLCTAPVWADDDHSEPDGAPTGICEKPVSVTSDKPTLDGLTEMIGEMYARGLVHWSESEDIGDVSLESEAEALEPLEPREPSPRRCASGYTCCSCYADPWTDWINTMTGKIAGRMPSSFNFKFQCTGIAGLDGCHTFNFTSIGTDSRGIPNVIVYNASWYTCSPFAHFTANYTRGADHFYTYPCNWAGFSTSNRYETLSVGKCQNCICRNVIDYGITCTNPLYHASSSYTQNNLKYYSLNVYWGNGSTLTAKAYAH
jgi:hypothetical protein